MDDVHILPDQMLAAPGEDQLASLFHQESDPLDGVHMKALLDAPSDQTMGNLHHDLRGAPGDEELVAQAL